VLRRSGDVDRASFSIRRLEGSRWWVRRTRLWRKNVDSTLES
jgi:hypothetical protein